MAALPAVLRVGWFRRRCGVGGDAGVAGHHDCVQKITEDAMRPLAEFTPFDGNRLLGLDVLGLRGVAQRHVMRRSPDGARARPGRGALAPVRSSWWRGLAHTPVGKSAAHLRVRCRRYECRAHFVPRRILDPVERPAALPAAPLVPMALAHLVLPVVGQVLQRSLELAPYVHAQGAGVCVRGRHAATQYVGSCEMIGGRTNGAGNRPHMSP